jgi:hypothetical protein
MVKITHKEPRDVEITIGQMYEIYTRTCQIQCHFNFELF